MSPKYEVDSFVALLAPTDEEGGKVTRSHKVRSVHKSGGRGLNFPTIRTNSKSFIDISSTLRAPAPFVIETLSLVFRSVGFCIATQRNAAKFTKMMLAIERGRLLRLTDARIEQLPVPRAVARNRIAIARS